jgi:hypothetical protein
MITTHTPCFDKFSMYMCHQTLNQKQWALYKNYGHSSTHSWNLFMRWISCMLKTITFFETFDRGNDLLLFDHVDNQESVLSSPLLSLQHGSIRSKWIIPNHQNPMRQSKIANPSYYISIPLLGSTSWTFLCLLPFIVSKCFWGSNLQTTCSLVLQVLRTYLSS